MPGASRLFRRFSLALLGARSLAPVLREFGRGLLSIFTLHRFANPDLGRSGHDPTALREHLAFLRRNRYRLVGLKEVLRLLEDGNGRWSAPTVAFTVDDGYAGFAQLAAPIFAEFDCPVTLFVTTGFLDGQLWFWWDRVSHLFEHTRRCTLSLSLNGEEWAYHWSTPGEQAWARQDALARLEWVAGPEREAVIDSLSQQLDVELPGSPPPAYAPISWDDVRRTAKLGATFGPHTVTHPILSLATDEACEWEIRESYRRLREETDACVPIFCYPNGERRAFGRREIETVRRAGLEGALTTVPDYARSYGQRFTIPRFPYPDDRAHLVHTVAGLVRLKRMLRPRGLPKASDVTPLIAGVRSVCVG
ncbi:MAG TPA: polysaccharide deacetylase family protein [Gemmatimonadales bacterium]|nr:polysaccharide deacetylase family protein [Gemmatimonadales bacterium]